MEVLLCSELRETGYSFLLITAHSSWETPWDRPWWHLSHVWARHILHGSSVHVGKMLLSSSKCSELINKDSAHCISHEESSAHQCFYLGTKGIAFPSYFFPLRNSRIFSRFVYFYTFFCNFFSVPTFQLCIMVHLLVSLRVLNVYSSLQSFPMRFNEVPWGTPSSFPTSTSKEGYIIQFHPFLAELESVD